MNLFRLVEAPVVAVALALTAANAPLVAAVEPRDDQGGDRQQLRARIDKLLRQELTEGWYPRAVDREQGGFHQNFDHDWSPQSDANRFLVYQARMAWTAAAFAEYAEEHRDEYLAYARHGIEYLDQVMRDREHGGFHWILGPDGEVDPRLGDEKHVYGTAFVLYAASKVHAVSGDELALQVGRDAFNWLEEHAHDDQHGGYIEALAREGEPLLAWGAEAPISERVDRLGVYYGFKSMNAHIHLLEALAEFYRVEPTPLVEERLREVHAIVRDRIAVEPGALNLYLTRDWRATPAHDSFGHDIETAYLLVEAAEALGIPDDERAWRMARLLVDHALDWGWDEDHGGFYDKGEAFAGQIFDTTKVWWAQAEGLNTLMLLHNKYGHETDRYIKAFHKQWAFIDAHQIDHAHGGWFSRVARDGALLGDGHKATQWKANYHTTRAMMNVARMLASDAH